MSLFSLFSLLRPVARQSKGSPRGRRRRDRLPGPRFLPRLEALECRALPSTLTVLNNADSGSGSLRAMLAPERGTRWYHAREPRVLARDTWNTVYDQVRKKK